MKTRNILQSNLFIPTFDIATKFRYNDNLNGTDSLAQDVAVIRVI